VEITLAEALHLKYRPRAWGDVLGQDAVVKSLSALVEAQSQHAFLLVGPSGTGKTTLARISAECLGCDPGEVVEVDAATYTGIDEMRKLTSMMDFMPLNGKPLVFIVDECFAVGSFVATPEGKRRIETLRPGDFVLSGGGSARVSSIFRSKIPLARVVKISIGSGKSILCSCDHLFFTARGWVEARKLECGDELQSEASLDTDMLRLWDRVLIARSNTTPLRPLSYAGTQLCNMWGGVSQQVEDAINVLEGVREQIGGFSTNWYSSAEMAKCYSSGHKPFSPGEPRSVYKIGSEVIGTHEQAESDDEAGCYREDDRYTHQKWYELNPARASWRQWKAYRATKVVGGRVKRECCRICRWFRYADEWLPNLLQSRFGIPRSEVGNRGGRSGTFSSTESSEGQKERGNAGTIGVDSVTSYEQGGAGIFAGSGVDYSELSSGYVTFYDLEIEGHPSYFVEDVLVHNCHRLSAASWASLLKSIEEPPDWAFWFFCTTDAGKVPANIVTRCTRFALRPLPWQDILSLLLKPIAEVEGYECGDKVLGMCARAAEGSPRQALVNLAACANAADESQAAQLLQQLVEEGKDAAYNLAKALMDGSAWAKIAELLAPLKEENPESVRHVVRAYATTVALGAKSDKAAHRALAILDNFSQPFYSGDGISPLVLAAGRTVLL
jgi:DNA polymerase III gamma/tau subunit